MRQAGAGIRLGWKLNYASVRDDGVFGNDNDPVANVVIRPVVIGGLPAGEMDTLFPIRAFLSTMAFSTRQLLPMPMRG